MTVIDTNVLVHASALASPHHGTARAALSRVAGSDPIAVTRQILREFLAVTTRPQTWAAAATLADATRITDGFVQRFAVLEDGPQVWDELMSLARRFAFGGKQLHDANIVATMLAHGETRLLTFNSADFKRFGTVIQVIVP